MERIGRLMIGAGCGMLSFIVGIAVYPIFLTDIGFMLVICYALSAVLGYIYADRIFAWLEERT